MAVQIGGFDCALCKGTAAGKAAAAAVGAGHCLLYQVYAGIFLNLEAFCHKVEDQCEHKAQNGHHCNCPDDDLDHSYFIVNVYSFLSFSRKSHRKK